MGNESTFNLGSTQAMPRDFNYIITSSYDPKIPILIFLGEVSCFINIWNFFKIRFFIACWIIVYIKKHCRPWFTDNEVSLFAWTNRNTFLVDHVSINPEKRLEGASGLKRNRRKGSNHKH